MTATDLDLEYVKQATDEFVQTGRELDLTAIARRAGELKAEMAETLRTDPTIRRLLANRIWHSVREQEAAKRIIRAA